MNKIRRPMGFARNDTRKLTVYRVHQLPVGIRRFGRYNDAHTAMEQAIAERIAKYVVTKENMTDTRTFAAVRDEDWATFDIDMETDQEFMERVQSLCKTTDDRSFGPGRRAKMSTEDSARWSAMLAAKVMGKEEAEAHDTRLMIDSPWEL